MKEFRTNLEQIYNYFSLIFYFKTLIQESSEFFIVENLSYEKRKKKRKKKKKKDK
jgi:hypothetical protein